jgi:tRNA pseudouridine38-40 synthase
MMRKGAEFFVGEHDFAAFRGAGCAAKTTIRTVNSVEINKDGELLHFDVNGVGFLRNMVRIMAGTLVEIGFGRREPESVNTLLQSHDRSSAGVTAPPQGLSLVQVFFGDCFSFEKKS